MAMNTRSRDTLLWGVILILVGVVFLLETLGVDAWDAVWRLWPVILIIWGGWKLWFGLRERSARAAAGPRPESSPDSTQP